MPQIDSMINALEKSGNVTLNGQMYQENDDSLTIQVGGSMFDIPKRHILSRRDVDAKSGGAEGVRIVDVTIDRDAKLIQRTPIEAGAIPAFGGGGGVIGGFEMSACACACECNCACDCACGSREEMGQFLRTMAFRNPMVPRSARF